MASFDELVGRPDDWATLFPQQTADPEKQTFELGLALGGTVSAGAYTAGVIDFLIEALDAWQNQTSTHNAPTWKVKLKVASGTSGGGVTAALLARALSYQYPPIRKDSSPKDQALNPFYRVWVKELDILKMLTTEDLNAQTIPSLLNPAPLDNCKNLIAHFDQAFPGLSKKKRTYVDNPFPIILTLTNLRGIPYQIDMGGRLSQEYVDHADYQRLAVFSQGLNANYKLRPDELGVTDAAVQTAPGYIHWETAAEYALGTAAFPVGFPLRALSKPVKQLRYRPFVVDDPLDPVKQGTVKWSYLVVPGSTLVSDQYNFLAADGGMVNNEPINLCRQVLAGYVVKNDRAGDEARRAVLLVDPFADKAEMGPKDKTDLFGGIGPLLTAWKEQARYDSRDLYLASNPNIFSRFMITATKAGTIPGGSNIATACASAFGGFLHEDYRRHDYLLGRQNCQQFLRETFCVHAHNPLVKDWVNQNPTDPLIFTGPDNVQSVRLIPLYGACSSDELTVPFPVGRFGADAHLPPNYQSALTARIDKLVDKLKNNYLPTHWYEDIYILPIIHSTKDELLKTINNWISDSLKKWGL